MGRNLNDLWFRSLTYFGVFMNINCLLRQIGLLLILTLPTMALAQAPALADDIAIQEVVAVPTFSEALMALGMSSLSERAVTIAQIAQYKNPRTLPILKALLAGKLVKSKADGQILIVDDYNDQVYQTASVMTGQSLDSIERGTVKKIKLSNRLRTQVRILIAELQINSDDAELRLQAVKDLAKKPNDKALILLKDLLKKEKNTEVVETLELFFDLQNMQSSDNSIRLAAIESLKQKTSLEAMNRLRALTEKNSQGEFLEADKDIRKMAKSALVKMESRLHMYEVAETVFFGLSLGAVLVLAAIGLTITFGVMGVINMAHGELMMLGAYTTYVMQQIIPNNLALALLLSVPAAFMVSGMVGIGIERGIIRFLYGRPLETLLATFGVSLFLQQTVRSIFSPLNRSVSSPEFMSGSWQINEFLSFTWNRFYIIIFCLLVFAVLLQILRRTKLGLEVRAVSQNRTMAKAMGIPTDRVDAMTFGLGSGIAGVAGVALSQITNVGPNLGQAYIVDSFMVVVFGGVGNLWGTLVAGFSLGIANKVLEPFAGAVLAKILVLIFIILFIQKRPRGLFPQKGRAAES